VARAGNDVCREVDVTGNRINSVNGDESDGVTSNVTNTGCGDGVVVVTVVMVVMVVCV
jgi:hypothetical protein